MFLLEEKKGKKDLELKGDDQDNLSGAWNGGLSRRFNDDYRSWLRTGWVNDTYLQRGNVYFHTNLKVGSGAAANVYLGICPSDGREVAVKVFAAGEEFADKHFNQERSSMKEHVAVPGIVQYISSFEHSFEDHLGAEMHQKVVVLELMEGSLAEAMTAWKQMEIAGTAAHLEVIKYVSASLLYTLARLNYGAHKNLAHRDVKPDNIMIDHLYAIRLGDFGISKVVEKLKEYCRASTGGPEAFASPEALDMSGVGHQAHRTSDLYSLGMVMLSMMSLREGGLGLPRDFEPQRKFLETEVPNWSKHQSFAFQRLVLALLHRDPRKRAFNDWLPPGMTPHRLVLAHPFFWSSDNELRFLVTLGTYKVNFDDREVGADLLSFRNLKAAVKDAIQQANAGHDSWFELVNDLEQSNHATPEDLKKNPFGLLKFIRNKYIHLNDSEMHKDIRMILMHQPVFQRRFPELIVRCWEALLDSIDNVKSLMQHAQLREFFERPVELESFRRK